jgi:hypothetical protein
MIRALAIELTKPTEKAPPVRQMATKSFVGANLYERLHGIFRKTSL